MRSFLISWISGKWFFSKETGEMRKDDDLKVNAESAMEDFDTRTKGEGLA